jgi:hypothetical protein
MGDMTLPQNSLGRTGLLVTKLGYGAMEVRGVTDLGRPAYRRRHGGADLERGGRQPGSRSSTRRTITGAARSTSAGFCRIAAPSSY